MGGSRTWLPDRRWSTCSTRACARPNPHATRMPLPKRASTLTRKPLHSPQPAWPSRIRQGRADDVQRRAAPVLALTAPLGGSSYSDMVGARDRGGGVDGPPTVLAHGVFLIFLAPFHRSHSHATPKSPARVCSPALQWLRASCAALVLGGGEATAALYITFAARPPQEPQEPLQKSSPLNVTLNCHHCSPLARPILPPSLPSVPAYRPVHHRFHFRPRQSRYHLYSKDKSRSAKANIRRHRARRPVQRPQAQAGTGNPVFQRKCPLPASIRPPPPL